MRRIPFSAFAVAGLASFVALAVGITLYISSAASLRATQTLLAERAETQVDAVEHRLHMLLRAVEEQAAWLAGAFAERRIAIEDAGQSGAILFGALAPTPQVAALCILDPAGDIRFWQPGRRADAKEAWCAYAGRSGRLAGGSTPSGPGWRVAEAVGPRDPVSLLHTTPLRRGERLLGVLVQVVPVSALSQALADARGAGKATPFVLLGEDRVLAHPALAAPEAGEGLGALPPLDAIGDAVLARMRSPDPIDPIGMRALSRASVAVATVAGERHLIIYRRIDRYGPQSWTLGIHVNTREGGQLAEMQRVLDSVLAGLAVLALAAAAAFLAGRRVSGPVRLLANAARRVRDGSLADVPRLPRSAIAEFDDASGSFNQMVEGLRERDMIRDTLGRFVSDEVARGLLSGGGRLEPVQTEASVLVCDIEGFTALTESLGPAGVVEFLNAYFGVMVAIVERHRGVITQFQGDAILAVFNVPAPDPAHAPNALRAAIELAAAADRHDFAGVRVRNRVGVCTGHVVAGAVGSPGRQTYTVHGSAVNMASRLEALNKDHGTRILVAASTAARCGDFRLRKVADSRIRGYDDAIALFTPESA
jgi:class 3 adenylate cyclase